MAISPKYVSAVRDSRLPRLFSVLSVSSAPSVLILFLPRPEAGRFFPAGKDSTSVGPFFLRKASFIRAISASLTKQIVTSESRRSSPSNTLCEKTSRGRRATRTARWRFRIMPADFLYLDLSQWLRRQFPLLPCRWPRHYRRCLPHSRRAADAPRHTPRKRE